MPLKPHRLLGFAFASADLLVEIAPDGIISFALGASEALSGAPETALTGRDWRDFIEPIDRRMLAMLLDGLEPGRRAGPVMVRLAAPERAVTLTALALPQNRGSISCALAQARYEPALFEGRLADRAAFETLTRDLLGVANGAGKELELSFVELAGLSAARQDSTPAAREELEAQLTALLRAQAWGGAAATELEHDRFALVRTKGETPDAFAARLGRLMGKVTDAEIVPAAQAMGVGGVGRPQQVMRALRYALDGFSHDGADFPMPATLAEALNLALDKALGEASVLGAAISDKTFRLAYQPVVELQGSAVHHFEVLVRFGEDQSPFPQIRMAEELDLIEALDFAVLERAVGVMAPRPDLKLAVNISGRTIVSGAYVERALRLIAAHPQIEGRLMFELTESAAIDDLQLADNHIQALRGAGCEMCLDDFGAGAASLAYLQQLRLDVLKIDGRYIRDLQFGSRSATFIKHLVDMCRELGMRTLAEMVETSIVEDAVRRVGVDYAQGWLYGLASDEPVAPAPKNQWAKKAG
ncbi:MAG: EAL domain-containing protein [Proteobacteria bacterium]|nr:EAL domain-containing protein [Pseudomonadota bacterium]